jgi:hypothetical protein
VPAYLKPLYQSQQVTFVEPLKLDTKQMSEFFRLIRLPENGGKSDEQIWEIVLGG